MQFQSSSSRRLVRVIALAAALAAMPALRAATPGGGPSADDILSKAKTQAQAQHKNILLEFGASWCGNCRLYDRFLDDPQMHAILSRAFVFATMDTGEHAGDTKHANTPGGVDFEASIGGKGEGFPWLVILDADGKPIISSDRPDPKSRTGKSNTGYPDAAVEVDWFVEMLRRSAPSLSAQDLASVRAWLNAHSTTQHH
jgi:thiol-disulfide isomerase/thioredoxin